MLNKKEGGRGKGKRVIKGSKKRRIYLFGLFLLCMVMQLNRNIEMAIRSMLFLMLSTIIVERIWK